MAKRAVQVQIVQDARNEVIRYMAKDDLKALEERSKRLIQESDRLRKKQDALTRQIAELALQMDRVRTKRIQK